MPVDPGTTIRLGSFCLGFSDNLSTSQTLIYVGISGRSSLAKPDGDGFFREKAASLAERDGEEH